MSEGLLNHQARSHTLWHLTAYVAAAIAVGAVLRWLAPVLAPVLAAGAVAYLLAPLVGRLERRGLPRSAAAALLLVGFAVLLLTGLAILVPLVVHDVGRFLPRLPALAERAVAWLQSTLGITVPGDWRQAVAEAGERLHAAASTASGPILRLLAFVLGGVFSFLVGFFQLLVIPVFAYYFLVDWPKLVAAVRGLIPPRRRTMVVEVLRELDLVVSTWVRGQLLVVTVETVLYIVFLSLLRVQLAVPIAILAGLLSFIPYVGVGTGLTLALLFSVLDWHGPARVIGVAGVFAGIQGLEAVVLTPLLVGKKVGLGEAGALFAVIAGGELLGFVGMIVAIPVAAAIAVLLRRVHRHYLNTDFYKGDPPGEGAASGVAEEAQAGAAEDAQIGAAEVHPGATGTGAVGAG